MVYGHTILAYIYIYTYITIYVYMYIYIYICENPNMAYGPEALPRVIESLRYCPPLLPRRSRYSTIVALGPKTIPHISYAKRTWIPFKDFSRAQNILSIESNVQLRYGSTIHKIDCTITMIFVGSEDKALYRNYRQATKKMVLVIESKIDCTMYGH